MKQLHIIISLLLSLLLVTSAQATDNRKLTPAQSNNAVSEKRIALVIGNSAYANSPLKNPVNDAKDVANKLRKLGFEVVERHNLTTKQIGRTLSEFRSKLVPGSVALVFYAGHGLQIKGENYLPAVDADIEAEEDVQNQSLAVRQVMDVLDEAKTRLNLVFLDACRNNPYARSFRSSAGDGLARISAPSGTLISYATRPGSVAQDGDGHNGLYTSKLLAQMDSNLQIEQALKQVVTAVKKVSQGKQEPWMEGSIEGDFCFAGCVVGSVTQISSIAHVKSNEEIEQDSWESARSSNDIDAIKEYTNQYPNGRFGGQAKILIATLNKSTGQTQQSYDAGQQNRPLEMPKGFVSQGGMIWMPISLRKTWADANAYCNSSTINSLTGWRLPTLDELRALYASEAMKNQGWTLDSTWSSVPFRSGNHYMVYLIDVSSRGIQNGKGLPVGDQYINYVTCVHSDPEQSYANNTLKHAIDNEPSTELAASLSSVTTNPDRINIAPVSIVGDGIVDDGHEIQKTVGDGKVYFFKKSVIFAGRGAKYTVTIDDKSVGVVKAGKYVVTEVSPGNRRIAIYWQDPLLKVIGMPTLFGDGKCFDGRVNVTAGEHYYFEFPTEVFGNPCAIANVSESTALNAINNLQAAEVE